MDANQTSEQTHYNVDKYVPTYCPKCLNRFNENGKNGFYILSYRDKDYTELRNAINIPKLEPTWVICAKCRNITMQILLESRRYISKVEAERACAEEGFSCLTEYESCGKEAIVQGEQDTSYKISFVVKKGLGGVVMQKSVILSQRDAKT